jgi:hypothetical protein
VSRVPSTVTGPLVAFLRAEGLLDTPTKSQTDAIDELVARFRRHPVVERGLRAGTIDDMRTWPAPSLERWASVADLGALDAEQVTGFVLAQAK